MSSGRQHRNGIHNHHHDSTGDIFLTLCGICCTAVDVLNTAVEDKKVQKAKKELELTPDARYYQTQSKIAKSVGDTERVDLLEQFNEKKDEAPSCRPGCSIL